MTDQISPKQFRESEGVEDWRVVGDGANAYFRTGSLAAGAPPPQAVSALPRPGELQPHPVARRHRGGGPAEDLVDPRSRGVRFWFEQMNKPRPDGGGAIHIAVWVPYEQAEARIAAALAAGGRLVRDEFAPSWWTLADAAGNEADIATTKGRE